MRMGRSLVLAAVAAVALATPALAVTVHLQHTLVRGNVRVHFNAPALPEGGYYYAVVVLRPYKHYTRSSPPPCSTSSDMQRADYGWPATNGVVSLALTPARSHTHHWCRAGHYEGAVYAVPHAPPCEAKYPCRSEPYEAPSPCWNIEGRPVCGVVALPKLWQYPEPLPAPLAKGTTIVGRFSVKLSAT
jgi:hypothetical protein